MKKMFRLTKEGIDEFKKEHKTLVAQRIPIAERIKQARELGDLSENAEYQTAREEQDRLEIRISEVEHILQNTEVIKRPPNGSKQAQLGSKVKLRGEKGETKEFQIVGTVEADPLSGKISDESPIGMALMGKKVGDMAKINNSSAKTGYKIVAIG